MTPTLREVKRRHEGSLLALPGVVSVGIGLDERGREAIVVGLDRPRPELAPRLPADLEGFPVRIEVIGPVRGW